MCLIQKIKQEKKILHCLVAGLKRVPTGAWHVKSKTSLALESSYYNPSFSSFWMTRKVTLQRTQKERVSHMGVQQMRRKTQMPAFLLSSTQIVPFTSRMKMLSAFLIVMLHLWHTYDNSLIIALQCFLLEVSIIINDMLGPFTVLIFLLNPIHADEMALLWGHTWWPRANW